MGKRFRPEPISYNLTFDGTSYEGLEVRACCCSVDEYRKMLQAAVNSGSGINEKTLAENDWILALFAKNLLSWNLDDMAGEPVPATLEGLKTLEQTLVTILLTSWQVALTNVPAPLKNASEDGATSEEQSLGLGSASTSLQS